MGLLDLSDSHQTQIFHHTISKVESCDPTIIDPAIIDPAIMYPEICDPAVMDSEPCDSVICYH